MRRVSAGRVLLWASSSGFVFLLVWQQIQSVRLAYESEVTRRLVVSLRDRDSYLQLELERLAAPTALAAAAHRRLGMIDPTPESLVALGEPSPSAGTGAPTLLSRLFGDRQTPRVH